MAFSRIFVPANRVSSVPVSNIYCNVYVAVKTAHICVLIVRATCHAEKIPDSLQATVYYLILFREMIVVTCN